MADEMKIGAYVCKGCGIGDRLNADQLATTATRDGKAAICQQHDFLCNEDGVKMIQADIDNEGVNRVVIVGCSRRAKTEAFAFDNVSLHRANSGSPLPHPGSQLSTGKPSARHSG